MVVLICKHADEEGQLSFVCCAFFQQIDFYVFNQGFCALRVMPSVEYEYRILGENFKSRRPLYFCNAGMHALVIYIPSLLLENFYSLKYNRRIVKLMVSQERQNEFLVRIFYQTSPHCNYSHIRREALAQISKCLSIKTCT